MLLSRLHLIRPHHFPIWYIMGCKQNDFTKSKSITQVYNTNLFTMHNDSCDVLTDQGQIIRLVCKRFRNTKTHIALPSS